MCMFEKVAVLKSSIKEVLTVTLVPANTCFFMKINAAKHNHFYAFNLEV